MADEIKNLTLAHAAEPEVPIDQIEPRLRLGTLIRRARVGARLGLAEVSNILGITHVQLGHVERGMVPLGTDHLQQIASLTKCDYQSLVSASRDFQQAVWSDHQLQSIGDEMTGAVRTVFAMPPEQLFVEYREGWVAGASGREDPGDMSPEWTRGMEDGRMAFETALRSKRLDLGITETEAKG